MSDSISPSELVKKAEDILDGALVREKARVREKGLKLDKSSLWDQTSQLRNLVQITQSESEVPVLKNFIRYQQGRRSTKDFWALIGNDVIGVLETIDGAVPGNETARSRAIRNFFGYLVRHYVYLNETQKPKRKQDANGESGRPE